MTVELCLKFGNSSGNMLAMVFMSAALGHRVPGELVKHCSQCFCEGCLREADLEVCTPEQSRLPS